MDLKTYLSLIPKIEQVPLEAAQAHLQMAPPGRRKQLEAYMRSDEKEWRPAAVMICCYPDENGKMCFPLIERSDYSGVHASQIGLPGGKVEPSDTSLWHTATRELQEEIGVRADKLIAVRQLTPLHIPPSRFLVTPFVSILKETPKLEIDTREVASVIPMHLHTLTNDLNSSEAFVRTSYLSTIKVPGYHFENQWVWGATAMILQEFKALLKAVITD